MGAWLVVDRKSGTNFHCPKSSWTVKSGVVNTMFSLHCKPGSRNMPRDISGSPAPETSIRTPY